MIAKFKDKAAEDVFHGINSKEARRVPMQIWQTAVRKLDMINAAHELKDLASPPGNKLEALKGDLKGFFSIRINDQYRIIFRWMNGNADDIQIADYHK